MKSENLAKACNTKYSKTEAMKTIARMLEAAEGDLADELAGTLGYFLSAQHRPIAKCGSAKRALQLFATGKTDARKYLRVAWAKDEMIYASDGTAAIRIPAPDVADGAYNLANRGLEPIDVPAPQDMSTALARIIETAEKAVAPAEETPLATLKATNTPIEWGLEYLPEMQLVAAAKSGETYGLQVPLLRRVGAALADSGTRYSEAGKGGQASIFKGPASWNGGIEVTILLMPIKFNRNN